MLEPVVDPDNGLFLFSETRSKPLHFRGEIYAQLAPLLDGQRSIESIYELLADHHSPPAIFLAITNLLRYRLLADQQTTACPERAAYWDQIGMPPEQAQAKIHKTVITLRLVGCPGSDLWILSALLERQGFTVAPDGDLVVVATDHYLQPELDDWNRQAHKQNVPWLLLRPIGMETWLGPLFRPAESACWECLAHRLRWHRRLERHLEQTRPGSGLIGAPRAHSEALMAACYAHAVEAITRWVGAGNALLHNKVLSRNSISGQEVVHHLRRRPQCPVCGVSTVSSGVAEALPIHLQPRPLHQRRDGGYRAQAGHLVLREIQPHLSPITGIISSVEPGGCTPRPGAQEHWPTPIFIADHNFSDSREKNFFLREGLRRRSGGKGITEQQAMLSALAESIERYCGVFDGSEPRLRAPWHQLAHTAIHPNACMGFSSRQYEQRSQLNRHDHKSYWVPLPLDGEQPIDWSPLWSLTREQTIFLPTSFCYYGYISSDPVYAYADSNGCAAGSCLEEAILQGLLELIERDAVALWWYNRLSKIGIELAAVDHPYIPPLLRYYNQHHRDVWALDITSDINIPTFAALSCRTDQPQQDIIYGFASHPDPTLALIRALTELNQSLEAVPCASDPASRGQYRGTQEQVTWWRNVTISSDPYLRPDPQRTCCSLPEGPALLTNDLSEVVRACVDELRHVGIEVLVLDQTRPDITFPVVRVVAPGLRHFWPRFGAGRLYAVPVEQGWQQSSLQEDEFNPYPVHF